MSLVYFITHPEVVIDAEVPVPQWPLSEKGRARMNDFVAKDWVHGVTSVYCSTEKKAIDGAAILSEQLGLTYTTIEELGENDRSSTGFLPKEAFEAMADRFFNNPEQSVEGWERAIDAQARIVQAVSSLIRTDTGDGDIAIVSHGGVGALLLCHLSGSPISRSMDQPGGGGGNVICFEKDTLRLVHGWKSFEEL
ncbi:MAG: phosphoglycerate mutase family protein [Verrucomicrobiae bacterium]|nr:phosphoglycerate mutase family protein [Verrucomicrobiae bacterium]